MKKAIDLILFLRTFVVIDLLVFFALYFLHSLVFKGFPISEAVMKGGYEIFWRLMSLQLVIQVCLMSLLSILGQHKGLWSILGVGLASIALAITITYSFSDIPKFLFFTGENELSEGLAVLLSIGITWLTIRLASKNITSGLDQ